MRLQFDHPAGGAEGDPGRLPAVVGHRGAPHRARENTVASFLAAASEGATWVELDARRSGDGVVVVHHDPVTADGRPVVEQAASELAAKGVADLAGVLAQLPPWLGVDVECKNLPGEPDYDEQQLLAGMVAEVITASLDAAPRSPWRGLLISSFNPMLLLAIAPLLDGTPTGLLHSDAITVAAGIDLAREFGVAALCPHVDCADLGADVIAAAHAAQLAVLVWTVDDADRGRSLAAAGVDAICTNDPAGIVAALVPPTCPPG